jgi:hypothetical protein
MATEEQLKDMEAKLRAEMKRHDWYHAYSDDGRAFRAGDAHRKQIDAAFKAFKDAAGAEKAHALWNECSPHDFHIVQNGEAS